MTDLLLYESGDGGELLLKGNDLAAVFGYENSTYLAMFGGGDWWGNYLCPDNQFLSKTEAILKTTPLTSAGRKKIEDAINADLSYLSDIEGTKWSVALTITQPARLGITITINGKQFNYMWNPDKMFLTYQV